MVVGWLSLLPVPASFRFRAAGGSKGRVAPARGAAVAMTRLPASGLCQAVEAGNPGGYRIRFSGSGR